MNNKKKKNNIQPSNVDKKEYSKDHEDYGYDFVPNLNGWTNIDEQREKTKELEDM